MTSAMWEIAIGMALMIGASLYRYARRIEHEQHPDWSARQRLEHRLRERYGW
jgi:hypothetical protein